MRETGQASGPASPGGPQALRPAFANLYTSPEKPGPGKPP